MKTNSKILLQKPVIPEKKIFIPYCNFCFIYKYNPDELNNKLE